MPSAHPLPIERVALSHQISEPAFGDRNFIFYVRVADGRRSIVRQSLDSGFAQVIAIHPSPGASIGYGGGTFEVYKGELLAYAAQDRRLWAVRLDSGEQWPITPVYEGVASPTFSPDGRLVAFVVEADGCADVLLVEVQGGPLPVRLSDRPAFVNHPAFSPDGTRVAWQEWGAREMPWYRSWICIARFAERCSTAKRALDLLPTAVSTLDQPGVSHSSPQFSPDGRWLAYTSDASGWRSVWVADAEGRQARRLETAEGEIGFPDWVQRRVAVRWSPRGDGLIALRRRAGRDSLLRISWPAGQAEELPLNWEAIDDFCLDAAADLERVACVVSKPTSPPTLITWDFGAGRETALATGGVGIVDGHSLSVPEVLAWTTDGRPCYGVLYPAVGTEADTSLPPLLVVAHGGPTAEIGLAWNSMAQYFATRGWHCLHVNYRGSSGRGRAYQDALNGRWGEADVADVRSGAEYLIGVGRADRRRVAILGGSAGGYTALMALATQPDFWAAGVSLFGISDLYPLKQSSHRFEATYEETLIGPLPEAGHLWKERSPLTHVRSVRAPVLLFHGTDDKVVPHQQSADFAEAVRCNGGTAELVSYEGEGHGFLKEANRKDMLERIEQFLYKYVVCRQ